MKVYKLFNTATGYYWGARGFESSSGKAYTNVGHLKNSVRAVYSGCRRSVPEDIFEVYVYDVDPIPHILPFSLDKKY